MLKQIMINIAKYSVPGFVVGVLGTLGVQKARQVLAERKEEQPAGAAGGSR